MSIHPAKDPFAVDRGFEPVQNTVAVGFLVWDFDGTLGYREGLWSSALLAVLEEKGGDASFDAERLRAQLKTGFPWHTPEVSHTELSSPELWWEALSPVFVRAFEAGGLGPGDVPNAGG